MDGGQAKGVEVGRDTEKAEGLTAKGQAGQGRAWVTATAGGKQWRDIREDFPDVCDEERQDKASGTSPSTSQRPGQQLALLAARGRRLYIMVF